MFKSLSKSAKVIVPVPVTLLAKSMESECNDIAPPLFAVRVLATSILVEFLIEKLPPLVTPVKVVVPLPVV